MLQLELQIFWVCLSFAHLGTGNFSLQNRSNSFGFDELNPATDFQLDICLYFKFNLS